MPAPFDLNPGASLISVCPHPETHSALALVEGPRGEVALFQLPHRENRIIPLMDLPADAEHLVLGPGHSVFVMTSTHVLIVEASIMQAEGIGVVRLPAEAALATTSAAAFDNRTGMLFYLLSQEDESLLLVFDPSLQLAGGFRVTGQFAAQREALPTPPSTEVTTPRNQDPILPERVRNEK